MKRYPAFCGISMRGLRTRAAALLAAMALLFGQTVLAAHLCPPGLSLATLALEAGAAASTSEAHAPVHSDCHAIVDTVPQATALCIEDCRNTDTPVPTDAECAHDFVPAFVVSLPMDADPAHRALDRNLVEIPLALAPPSSRVPLRI